MRRLIAALLVALALVPPASASTEVGTVDRVQGESEGTVDGRTRVLIAGAPVHLDEEIVTSAGARVAIALADGTVLTVGENARLVIDRFVFDAVGGGALHATVAGAFRYVSAALKPGPLREASVTTPVAVIGVRGTDFWGGPIDGGFGVALFEGVISVTSGGVTTLLDAAGSGVNLSPNGGAPSAVTTWPDDKVSRALATVTFP